MRSKGSAFASRTRTISFGFEGNRLNDNGGGYGKGESDVGEAIPSLFAPLLRADSGESVFEGDADGGGEGVAAGLQPDVLRQAEAADQGCNCLGVDEASGGGGETVVACLFSYRVK